MTFQKRGNLSELDTSTPLEIKSPPEEKSPRKINFITPKFAGDLDRYQLSIRDSVYVL